MVTSANAMAAIQSLNAIGSQMTSTQSAIESGLAVNSAADNPLCSPSRRGYRTSLVRSRQRALLVAASVSVAN